MLTSSVSNTRCGVNSIDQVVGGVIASTKGGARRDWTDAAFAIAELRGDSQRSVEKVRLQSLKKSQYWRLTSSRQCTCPEVPGPICQGISQLCIRT